MTTASERIDSILLQSGVQGMKWGVRRDRSSRKRQRAYNKGMRLIDRVRLRNMTSADARKKYLDDKDAKWIEKAGDDKNIRAVTKQVNKEFKRVNGVLKEQYGGKGVKGAIERSVMPSTSVEYNRALKRAYDEILTDKTFSVYKLSPTRTREVKMTPNPDGTIKATIVERSNPKLNKQRASLLNHSDSDESDFTTLVDGMSFIILPDEDGFPDKVISPFEDEEEILQQSGVKGMKWGIRRDYTQRGGADGKSDAKDKPLRTKIGKHLNSLKRERQWKSVLREMDALSTKDITDVAKRVTLENTLKSLSRSKIGTKKDKEDYLRREHMDNEELTRKITRLRAKESLHAAVSKASKEQREFGQKVVQIGGALGVKYALTKSITPKDVFDTIKNPKSSADSAKSDLLKTAIAKVKAQVDKS